MEIRHVSALSAKTETAGVNSSCFIVLEVAPLCVGVAPQIKSFFVSYSCGSCQRSKVVPSGQSKLINQHYEAVLVKSCTKKKNGLLDTSDLEITNPCNRSAKELSN